MRPFTRCESETRARSSLSMLTLPRPQSLSRTPRRIHAHNCPSVSSGVASCPPRSQNVSGGFPSLSTAVGLCVFCFCLFPARLQSPRPRGGGRGADDVTAEPRSSLSVLSMCGCSSSSSLLRHRGLFVEELKRGIHDARYTVHYVVALQTTPACLCARRARAHTFTCGTTSNDAL